MFSIKRKINDFYEFPFELNLEKYSREYQFKKDILEKLDSSNQSYELSEEEKILMNIDLPKDYYEYRLKGVIVHSGTTEYGHYISLTMERETSGTKNQERWFEFSDAKVRQFNPDMMTTEAFGDKIEQ